MKKILICLLCLCTLLACTSCGNSAPDIEEVRDEIVALVEASYEVNEIIFGEGLPTYERGGDYDKEYNLYSDNDSEFDYYEYVTQESGYYFTDQIKWAAEKVYTEEYLEGLYTMTFDGYADENSGAVTTARYLDGNGWLLKYAFGENDPFDQLKGKKRRFDFDSMEVVKPSDSKHLNIKIDSFLEGETEKLNITLHLVKTDDGWRLDAPTY